VKEITVLRVSGTKIVKRGRQARHIARCGARWVADEEAYMMGGPAIPEKTIRDLGKGLASRPL